MAKDINRHFSKQDARVANRYRRQKCSLSLIVEEKQNLEKKMSSQTC